MATTKTTKTTKTKTTTKIRPRRIPPKDGPFSGARWTDTAGASKEITDLKEIQNLVKKNPDVFGPAEIKDLKKQYPGLKV